MRAPLLAVLTLTLAGCTTMAPVGSSTKVDPDTVPSCSRVCKEVGMQVAAIVFISNRGGCVCEPAQKPAAPASSSAAAMGGAVAVLIEEEEQQRQQQQQQANQSRSSTPGSTPGASPGSHR